MWIETTGYPFFQHDSVVTPHVGVWIETIVTIVYLIVQLVTPHVGVWIETSFSSKPSI